MRGSVVYKDTFYRALHISTGEGGPHLFFSRYDFERDEFETIFTLLDYRMSVPGDGSLQFSGYSVAGDPKTEADSFCDDTSYEFMEILFQPAGAFADDQWVRKCAGAIGKKQVLI